MSFSAVYGQQRASKTLRAAIRGDRVAGAYIFVGPPGVGKAFTALQFAKALNCLELEDDCCDRCTNCRLIQAGNFPDLLVPERQGRRIIKGSTATDRGKGYLIDIVSRLHFPPVMGKWKVVLLDPADGMTDEAANMLLKILEEPPSRTLFVLITTLETAVLPTVLSRCQRVRFPPLPVQAVQQYLSEHEGIPDELCASLAAAAQGSIERALELNRSDTLARKIEIVDFLLGLFDWSLPTRVDRSLNLLMALSDQRKERGAMEKIGRIIPMLARDLLSSACGFDQEHLLFTERGKQISKLAGRLQKRGALQFLELATEFGEGLLRNENPKNLLYFLGNRMYALLHSERNAASVSRGRHGG